LALGLPVQAGVMEVALAALQEALAELAEGRRRVPHLEAQESGAGVVAAGLLASAA